MLGERAWLVDMELLKRLVKRIRAAASDVGMTTAEYAVGTVAAVALATVG